MSVHNNIEQEPHFEDIDDYTYNPKISRLIQATAAKHVSRTPFEDTGDDISPEKYRGMIQASAHQELHRRLHPQDLEGYGHGRLEAWLESAVMEATDPWQLTRDTPDTKMWERQRGEPATMKMARDGQTWKAEFIDSETGEHLIMEGFDTHELEFEARCLMADNR